MKARVADTKWGRTLYSARRNWELRLQSVVNPEKSGILANAIIADKLIAHLSPKGGTFFDVGAQHGAIFSMARSNDPSLNVFAFEAEKEKAEILKANFPYAEVFEVAVGESEGEATFYLNPEASGYNSLVPAEDRKAVTVRVAPIDDLVHGVKVDVMKIDIEGAELGALRGADKTLALYSPTIMFECVLAQENALGYSAAKLWEFFADRDYEIFAPHRLAHDAPPLGKDAFCNAQHYPFVSHNYFAVSTARRIEVRDKARRILGVGS